MLILGGTVFLGRALVRAAQAEGYDVAILSRGLSGPDPDGVEVFRGDRERPDGLAPLEGQEFDVVVDTSRQGVSQVRTATAALRERTGRYVFTSSVSVYSDFSQVGITEESPTVEPLWPDTHAEEHDLAHYPALNVACEQVVQEALGERALVVRPGLIVGDHDPSDRFGYWPTRLGRGGDVLAPGDPDRPVQFIDVQDLAEFIVRADRGGRSGVYNACGPVEPITMGELLHVVQSRVGGGAQLVWVDDRFLVDRGVGAYLEMPLWVPDDEEYRGFSSVDVSKAVAAGLRTRPVEETVEAAIATERRLGPDRERRAGLRPERERELLEEWRSSSR